MRSLAALFRRLVIPFGALTGPRVIIGVPAGTIGIYDSANRLTGLLSPEGIPGGSSSSPGFFVFDPTSIDDYVALEAIAGFPGITFADSVANVIGRWSEGRTGAAGTTRRFFYEIATPRFTARNAAVLELVSESEDGTIDPVVNVAASGLAPPDLRVDDQSVARGLTGAPFVSAVNNGPHSATTTTDMVLTNYPHVAGRWYAFDLHTQVLLAGAGVWTLDLLVGGVQTDRFYRAEGTVATTCSSRLWWQAPTTGTTTFAVQATEASGATTLTLVGAAGANRWLMMTDQGA